MRAPFGPAKAACGGCGPTVLDLYLLHWRGKVPLAETVEAFAELWATGRIRFYGVSNLDTSDMRELWGIPKDTNVQTDQVLYNLAHRGIEWDLRSWLREHQIPVMAYAPFGHGELLNHPALQSFARGAGMTTAQVALAWLLAKPDVIVIPKTGRRERLLENLGALDHRLSMSQLAELDRLFPPPQGPVPLEMI